MKQRQQHQHQQQQQMQQQQQHNQHHNQHQQQQHHHHEVKRQGSSQDGEAIKIVIDDVDSTAAAIDNNKAQNSGEAADFRTRVVRLRRDPQDRGYQSMCAQGYASSFSICWFLVSRTTHNCRDCCEPHGRPAEKPRKGERER